MKKIQDLIKDRKSKHIFYIALVVIMVGWVIFRFAVIASENNRSVFNASRNAMTHGAPVETLVAENKAGVIYEPLAIKNNRAYVTAERAKKLKPGQKVGQGKITYVSNNIDLDTGMFLVRTSGVENGLQFAEFTANGFFIPLYAIQNNTVFIAEKNIAVARDIEIVNQDSENAYIVSGLNDGDIIILSNVNAGTKVKVK